VEAILVLFVFFHYKMFRSGFEWGIFQVIKSSINHNTNTSVCSVLRAPCSALTIRTVLSYLNLVIPRVIIWLLHHRLLKQSFSTNGPQTAAGTHVLNTVFLRDVKAKGICLFLTERHAMRRIG